VIGEIARTALGRSYAALCGRGTTALWLALRAIRRRDGPGEIILPDIVCRSVLDGILLAGFVPIFADVEPGRGTLLAASVARLATPRTRAVIVVHLYGHIADVDAIRRAAPGIPIVEDAVQGIGGQGAGAPVGTLGDLSFLSFDAAKMIGGRGGVLLFDDTALAGGIAAALASLPAAPDLDLTALDALLPPVAAQGFADQLRRYAPTLLRPFDGAPANVARILDDWRTLPERVLTRNAHMRALRDRLDGLPVALPEIRPGDALWCYTLTVPAPALARRLIHDLHRAGLGASALYTPLSLLFDLPGGAGRLAHRLVNLWVDAPPGEDTVEHIAAVVRAAPWPRSDPRRTDSDL
jgi:dTDP-4-amino-4,6-dideoxygalactose transaminase